MAANTIKITAQHDLGEEALRLRGMEQEAPREDSDMGGQGFALAQLVDKIAYAFANGLIVAMRELEAHIVAETQKASGSVNEHLGSLQASVQELTGALSEQRSLSVAVEEKCRELETITVSLRQIGERQDAELAAARTDAATLAATVSERFELASASLQDTEGRQNAQIAAVRDETREFSTSLSEHVQSLANDLLVQRDGLLAVRSDLASFDSRVEGFAERLDRQAEALRSMFAAYSERETQLEHLVDGLARLRTHSALSVAQL